MQQTNTNFIWIVIILILAVVGIAYATIIQRDQNADQEGLRIQTDLNLKER